MSENGKDGERLRSGASPFLFFLGHKWSKFLNKFPICRRIKIHTVY